MPALDTGVYGQIDHVPILAFFSCSLAAPYGFGIGLLFMARHTPLFGMMGNATGSPILGVSLLQQQHAGISQGVRMGLEMCCDDSRVLGLPACGGAHLAKSPYK